jgi:hypothetical protein
VILLAACEGTTLGDRVFGVVIALALIAFWVAVAWALVWLDREPRERSVLLVILVVAGIAVPAILGALSGVGLETLLLPAVIATLAGGAAAAHLLRVGVFRGAGAALAGGALAPLAVVVILLVVTYLGGACIGEELG